MSFSDIIKKSVIEKFQTADLTTTSITITLLFAVLIGLFIYVVYRFNTKTGFYNRGFNKSLATLPVITAAIMLAMSSNLTISLGMVGALSIVRFRNAVKEPVDLTYLFWSISIGIIVGAGLFELAILLSLVVAALLSFLDFLPVLRAPCILAVSAQNASVERDILNSARQFAKNVKIRSRNVSANSVEWIIELQAKDESALVQNVSDISNVTSVQLMTHDGDMRV